MFLSLTFTCLLATLATMIGYDAIFLTNISDLDTQFHHSLAERFGENYLTCLFLIYEGKVIISCIPCQVIGGVGEIALKFSD